MFVLFACIFGYVASIDFQNSVDTATVSQERDRVHQSTHSIEVREGGELHSHDQRKHRALMRRAKAQSPRTALGAEAKAAHVEGQDALKEAEHEHGVRSLMSTRSKGPYVRKKWCEPGYNDDLFCQKATFTTTTTTTVVHCVWDTWNEWNECTKSCGEGEKFRVRNPRVRATPGGRQCSGSRRETFVCNVDACPVATTTVASEPADDDKGEAQEGAQEEKKSGGLSMYIIIGGVGALVLLGAGAFFVMGDAAKPKRNQMMDINDMNAGFEEDVDDYGVDEIQTDGF